VTLVDQVRSRVREELIAGLRAALHASPPAAGTERVMLFGSIARGDFDGASDLDLLVIGGDGALDDGAIWKVAGHRNCDVIAWRREDWARARMRGDHPMVHAVLRDGVELWRAPDAAPIR
jgi:hypothetical protein